MKKIFTFIHNTYQVWVFGWHLIFIILLLSMGEGLMAQDCFVETTNSIQPSNYTINTNTPWTSQTYRINQDILITSGATLTIDASSLDIAAGKKILVNSGCTLEIKNGSKLYCSGTWIGIIANSGATVKVHDSGTVIADASTAIDAKNGATETDVEVYDDVLFCNNEVGIYIESYSGGSAMATTIEGSHFWALDLHAGGVGDYAIKVNGVTGGSGLVIGQSGAYYTDFTDYNDIEAYCIGIRINASKVTVENNFIHDLENGDLPYSDPEQTGILVKGGSGPTDYDFIAGTADVTPDYYNKIENCITGIYCKGHVNPTIYANEIDNDEIDDIWLMDAGVRIETNCDEIDIESNWIHNFNNYGIYENNNNGSAINNLILNTIEEGELSSADIHPYGIFVSETGVDDNLLVERNIMHLVETCVYAENVNNSEFIENDLHFNKYDAAIWAYGIRLLDCLDPIITGNFAGVEGATGWTTNTRSFLLEGCNTSMVSENHAQDVFGGIVVKGVSADANFWCNQLENCNHGFHFWDVGGGATAPIAATVESGLVTGNPSDNYWIPEEADFQLFLNGTSDLSAVTWLYQLAGGFLEYHVANTWCVGGALLPIFSDPLLGINHCESSPYRLENENERLLALKLNNDYEGWAEKFNNNLIDDTPLTWFKLFNFWQRIEQDSISTDFLSNEVAQLFSAVESSNMPNFIELNNAMSSRDYMTASEIIGNITPKNDLEAYWKEGVNIYINNLDTTGEFILNSEIEPELWSIANMDVSTNGPGVAIARAMLDTIFPVNEPEVNQRLSNFIETISIIPNPANSWIIINCSDPIYINDNFKSAILIDICGRIVKSVDHIWDNNSIFIGDLPNGIYTIQILCGQENITAKIIIQR